MAEFPTDSLTRYYRLINLLENQVNTVNNEYLNDPRWFLFSLRVSRKLLFHCKGFCLHSADTLFNETSQKTEDNTFVDVPGLFANLRLQIDCYSTFHHIFFDDVDWETKRLRFDLWRYDAHVQRINLEMGIEDDFKQLNELRSSVEKNSNFKSYGPQKQKFILGHDRQFVNWKFFPSRLSRKTHRISWTELFQQTGINLEVMNRAYGFLSMYVHSNFFSVLHLTEMDKSESYEARNFAITFSSFLLCFAIDDLASKFTPGKQFVEQMKTKDFEIVKSFIDQGRIRGKNKNFN